MASLRTSSWLYAASSFHVRFNGALRRLAGVSHCSESSSSSSCSLRSSFPTSFSTLQSSFSSPDSEPASSCGSSSSPGSSSKRLHREFSTFFGHWMGLGGLHERRLQKTGDSYCTVTAIFRKSVTCPALDRQADLRPLAGRRRHNLEVVRET